jgi:lipoprotein-anchoring transpeptidase ErfK/SrfK
MPISSAPSSDADLERAFKAGVDPGGAIFIHGTPDPALLGRDWTNGCIAVSNDDMDLIWQLVPDGTPITIRP